MICPKCNHNTRVTNSRASAMHPGTWRRRRECKSCGERFMTLEIEYETLKLMLAIMREEKEAKQ